MSLFVLLSLHLIGCFVTIYRHMTGVLLLYIGIWRVFC